MMPGVMMPGCRDKVYNEGINQTRPHKANRIKALKMIQKK